MLAIHDQFTRQMRDRLETTAIGLGLVRLLQDAKRFVTIHLQKLAQLRTGDFYSMAA